MRTSTTWLTEQTASFHRCHFHRVSHRTGMCSPSQLQCRPLADSLSLSMRCSRAVDMATTTNAAARMPPPNQLNILVSGDETGKVILRCPSILSR